MDVSVVVGNPKKGSRTLAIAEGLARRVGAVTGARVQPSIDLIDYAPALFEWPNEQLAALGDAVSRSGLLVVASPTYKATYTGLLKAFLDRYPNNGLDGVTAIPVMTSSSPDHALAVEWTLRPLLVELGATVPTRGLSFVMSAMDRLDAVLDRWSEVNLAVPGVTCLADSPQTRMADKPPANRDSR